MITVLYIAAGVIAAVGSRFDFHSCADPSLYPSRLKIRHRLLAARVIKEVAREAGAFNSASALIIS